MGVLVVTCVDARIHEHLHDLEASLGIATADRLQVPGGPLALVTPGPQQEATIGWLEFLARAKDVDTVILIAHQHCLAYRHKLGGFFHDEREVLERDLRAARRLVEDRVYGVRAHCYLVPWDEETQGGEYAAPQSID